MSVEDLGNFENEVSPVFSSIPQERLHTIDLVLEQLLPMQGCRGLLLGQSFASTDRGRGPLQDEDHSGSRPHSFPAYYVVRSGRATEWCRSGPVVAGS